jgi:NAD(P)-dependent dehydrogenase (short-subunit alcohol dehydrogenase family)
MSGAGRGSSAGPGSDSASASGAAGPGAERDAAASLAGRVILVTGGSSGIGRAATLAIGRAGATVVVSARRAEECERAAAEIVAAGGRAEARAADVTDYAQMQQLVDGVLARHGRLDGAFNNAGRILGYGELHEAPVDGFRAAFDLNAGGVFNTLRTQLPALYRTGAGSIVVNTALSGLRGRASLGLYSAAKAAALQLALVAAQEAGPRGVRVNVLAPGYVGSDAWYAKLGAQAAGLARGVPLRRIGRPEEVASAVVWLLGEGASYVNGAVLPIDGGLRLT